MEIFEDDSSTFEFDFSSLHQVEIHLISEIDFESQRSGKVCIISKIVNFILFFFLLEKAKP